MEKQLAEARVPLFDTDGRVCTSVRIIGPRKQTGPPSLIEIDAIEAREWGEERIQLLEGVVYDYDMILPRPGLRLLEGLVRRGGLSDQSTERGSILPRAFTGMLPLVLLNRKGERVAEAAVEVRSAKLDYRTDYREMLDFIAERSTDLLFDIRAQSFARLASAASSDPRTIVQRFSFVRHLVGSRHFRDAVARVLAVPHERTIVEDEPRFTNAGFRPTGRLLRQLVYGQPRFGLPGSHRLSQRFASLPVSVVATRPASTVDTPENRFVKYALASFEVFLSAMERQLARSRRLEDARLRREVTSYRSELTTLLSHSLFREIGDPQMLPVGSSVLQRRGGYREILSAWLRFNLAAKLEWDGGSDVYGGGKRDVATLYEYWLFFKILDLVKTKFRLPSASLTSLIERTGDSFGLKIKSGRHTAVEGVFDSGTRKFCVRFSFNRSFVRDDGPASQPESNYPAPGSWTRRMRPDFTLTLWPETFSEADAERLELIAHIHFDAKYRVEAISELFGEEGNDDLDSAEESRYEEGLAKRSDLLKMHSYRDAIRRSLGAYVLYPGTEVIKWRGFHELLPGLGAFPITPGSGTGIKALATFMDDVVDQLALRTSQAERNSFHVFQSHAVSAPPVSRILPFPERDADESRVFPPDEQLVLTVRCAARGEISSIVNRLRLFTAVPEVPKEFQRFANARYVFLYSKALEEACLLRVSDGPRLWSGEQIVTAGFADEPLTGMFMVYELQGSEPEFSRWKWSAEQLAMLSENEAPVIQVISLSRIAGASNI